jgi:ketosteroid isomerase-like protein
VPDRIPPPAARHPAEALELVCMAVSDGDLDAALAQYEEGAILRPWARPAAAHDEAARHTLSQLMRLRLPLSIQVRAVLPADELALILGDRQMAGTDPECREIELSGLGATVVRRQSGGSWRIAADAWRLSGPGAASEPD